jgi:hypothetical protein
LTGQSQILTACARPLPPATRSLFLYDVAVQLEKYECWATEQQRRHFDPPQLSGPHRAGKYDPLRSKSAETAMPSCAENTLQSWRRGVPST